MKAASYWSLAT